MRGASWAVGLPIGLMLFSGVCSALQPPTNALLNRASGSPVNAALISFAVGTGVLAMAALALRAAPDAPGLARLPWYAWMGGVYGAVFVACAAFSVPRIGVAPTLTLLIAGQAATALAVDHFALLGVVRHAVTPLRLAGMALVVGGVLLVRAG